ncbi:MAG: DUF2339 domain-containing protein [Myxococcales bacterium]|nr:DUF2339 domain-containing protein [Myxococcales bacterium]
MEALLALLGVAAFVYWLVLPGLAYRIARRTQRQVEDLEAKTLLYESQIFDLRRQLDAHKRMQTTATSARLADSAPLPALAPLFSPAAASLPTSNMASSPEPTHASGGTPHSSNATITSSDNRVYLSGSITSSTEDFIQKTETDISSSIAPINSSQTTNVSSTINLETTPEIVSSSPAGNVTSAAGAQSFHGSTSSSGVGTAEPASLPTSAEEAPAANPFDLEKFIGVRGAAWLGAIALAIAGTLFAKYSIENNLIPPALRIAFLILMGLASLVGSEVFFRPRYPATASPVCGAGIAILYAAFFAGHSAYDLFNLPLTFALMALTTVVAGLLSLRYDSVFISVLGLLGGFATPLLLSSGKDRPIGLFGYILLLDLGFLFISVRKRWTGVVWLSFVATLLLQVAWASKRLSPEKLPIALSVFFLFGILYFLLPSLSGALSARSRRDGTPDGQAPSPADPAATAQLLQLSVLAGLAPLLFGIVVAGTRAYAAQWPLLLGYTALLDVALVVVGVRRRQHVLPLSAAVSTFLTVALFLAGRPSHAEPLPLWSISLALVALASLFNLAARLGDRWSQHKAPAAPHAPPPAAGAPAKADAVDATPPPWLPAEFLSNLPLELSGFLGLFGLLGFAFYMAATLRDASLGASAPDPLGPTAILLIAAVLWLAERSRQAAGRIAWLSPLFAAHVGGTWLLWLVLQSGTASGSPQGLSPDRLLRGLSLPLLLSVLAGLLAARRGPQANQAPRAALVSEVTAAVLTAVSGLGVVVLSAAGPLLLLPMTPGLGLLFVGLFAALLWLSALRRNLTLLLPLALALVAACAFAVVGVYHHRGDESGFLPWLALYVVLLTLAPLFVMALRPVWRVRRGAYLASALAGPALFLPILQLVTDALGKRAIGILPLGFALLSVLGLAAVQRLARLPLSDAVLGLFPEAVRARRALGNQALFAACALGFVAVAIPLQLDRQWILIAWAIEAAAVWWLYRRLPHIGLKYFGVGLYAAVLLRLYPDAEFRHYSERGLIVVNWLLYTYGIPAACLLFGARGLSVVEAKHRTAWEDKLPIGGPRLAWYQLAYLLGLLSVFALINIEIADAFSAGRYVEFAWEHSYARDLTVSLAWGLYALLLLSIGMWQRSRALRFVSLGFMLLTIGKVFLYDLSNIRGIYRPLSFLGLAMSLIVVSLLYQRFVFRRDAAKSS